MKKIKISVALLLSSFVAKAQYTEYIDVASNELKTKSIMCIYNAAPDTIPAQYFRLGFFNNNYHWVKYTGAGRVVVNMNDSNGSYRELCTKQGDNEVKCDTVSSYHTEYKLFATDTIFQVWISKPLK